MLLHCKVFNVLHTVISILFFTSPYNLFVFQSTITNWRLVFFLDLLFITLYWFFLYINSLSLSIGNLSFSKIWWWFYNIKYALLGFFILFYFILNLVFLTWFVLYFILPLMHWVWEWVFPSITPLNVDNFIYFNLGKILYFKFFKIKKE